MPWSTCQWMGWPAAGTAPHRQASREEVHEYEVGLGERACQGGAGEDTHASHQLVGIGFTYPPLRAPFSLLVGPTTHELRTKLCRCTRKRLLDGDGPVFGDGPEAAEASCHSHQGGAPASCSAGVPACLAAAARDTRRVPFRTTGTRRSVAHDRNATEATRVRNAQADV